MGVPDNQITHGADGAELRKKLQEMPNLEENQKQYLEKNFIIAFEEYIYKSESYSPHAFKIALSKQFSDDEKFGWLKTFIDDVAKDEKFLERTPKFIQAQHVFNLFSRGRKPADATQKPQQSSTAVTIDTMQNTQPTKQPMRDPGEVLAKEIISVLDWHKTDEWTSDYSLSRLSNAHSLIFCLQILSDRTPDSAIKFGSVQMTTLLQGLDNEQRSSLANLQWLEGMAKVGISKEGIGKFNNKFPIINNQVSNQEQEKAKADFIEKCNIQINKQKLKDASQPNKSRSSQKSSLIKQKTIFLFFLI
jgi:hypothetical protein